MPANLRALTSLCRLRRTETDAGRRALSEALAQETELAEQNAVIEREARAARAIKGEFDRDALVAWLERMRITRERLDSETRNAEARTATARADLARRRVAETAAEATLAREVTALAAEAGKRDQVMLEDVARALRRAAGRIGPGDRPVTAEPRSED